MEDVKQVKISLSGTINVDRLVPLLITEIMEIRGELSAQRELLTRISAERHEHDASPEAETVEQLYDRHRSAAASRIGLKLVECGLHARLLPQKEEEQD
jgi:hypothetical protein